MSMRSMALMGWVSLLAACGSDVAPAQCFGPSLGAGTAPWLQNSRVPYRVYRSHAPAEEVSKAIPVVAEAPLVVATLETVSPSTEPPADIYAALDDATPIEVAPAPAPPSVVPTAASQPEPVADEPMDVTAEAQPRSTLARDIAAGFGIGGLATAALSVGGSVGDPSSGVIIFSSVSLGFGLIGMTTAGILELVADGEIEPLFSVSVSPTAAGMTIRF